MGATSEKKFVLVFGPGFSKTLALLKRKNPDLFRVLEKHILKVFRNPAIGKPLRNVLRNYRRVHVGSFVLLYEVYQSEVRLLDFDHHDRIYKMK